MAKVLFFCLSVCFMIMLAPASLQAAGIAVLSHADITPYRMAIAGFREHVDLPVHEYHLGSKNEHRDTVAKAVRQQQPELILVLGKSALNFTRSMQFGVPVVFVFVLHPNNDSNKSPSKHPRQPGEFGIAMSIEPEQQFKMLLSIAPGMKRIGVVYDPEKSGVVIRQAQAAAKRLRIHLVAMPASNQHDAAIAIADMMANIDAMWMIPDTTVLTSTTFKQMMRLSLQHAVALIGLAPKYVRAGSLFALSFDSRAIGLQAGDMAMRILNGETLAKRMSPEVVRFVLNKQTADRLGLYLSAARLKQAADLYPKRKGESN
ncbi:MAG: ABC transporter substrate binding protein [Mariprofundus sp.]|nr:ABC transporter substrate binding protein [Mariprofundus sp.]